MTALLFALSGAAAGCIQAGLLAWTAQKGPHSLAFLARLLLVAAVLGVAARAGHPLTGAAGWAAGFGIAVVVSYRGLR